MPMQYQPYQNYYMPNNQYQNPYVQQMIPQPPQAQFPVNNPTLNGRMVADFSGINASEVPMDGSKAVFPKQDLSEICIKYWKADGTIETLRYKPFADNTETTIGNDVKVASRGSDELYQGINKLGETLNERIDRLEELISKKVVARKKDNDE